MNIKGRIQSLLSSSQVDRRKRAGRQQGDGRKGSGSGAAGVAAANMTERSLRLRFSELNKKKKKKTVSNLTRIGSALGKFCPVSWAHY